MNLNEKLPFVIQFLLDKYITHNFDFYFPFHFKSNPDLYIIESQIPDLWSKTRRFLNRNDCFFTDNNCSVPFTKYN